MAMDRNRWHALRGLVTQLLRVLRRPAGDAALRRHLEAADRETRPERPPRYCVRCGSTDFEPFATGADRDRVRVLQLRCRACGQVQRF